MFETATVNEPSVFEPRKFYCIYITVGITSGQIISTDNSQNGSSLLPKVTQVQLTNPCVQQVRPGQISLAAGGMGIRPGVTMASMIRPTLQFQAIASGGQQKVSLIRVPRELNIDRAGK